LLLIKPEGEEGREMRRWAVRSVIVGLLALSCGYLLKKTWGDCLFVLRNLEGILAGTITLPDMNYSAISGLCGILFLLAMLIGTIPRKDGSYIDESSHKDDKDDSNS